MEPLIYKKIISFTLCLVMTMSLWASNKEKFEKHISKEFPITQNGEVHLLNKYGDVNVTTGDFKEVRIDIKIVVNAVSKEKADATFERINIEFNNSINYVSAITTIGEAQKSWWGSSSSCNNGGDFQIYYEVQMPESNSLELSNKYGNAYVDNLDGGAKITLKYGTLKMGNVNNKLNLTLGYGTANTGRVKDLVLEVKYSTLVFEEARDVHGTTKYSKISIEKAGEMILTTKYDNYDIGQIESLRNEGKYDHFKIDKVGTVDAESKYTDFKIGFLAKSVEFDLEYGGAILARVDAQFSEINMEGRYTDYKIKVENGANYRLDVESDYAGLDYPSAMQVVHHQEDGSEEEMEGYVGRKSGNSLIKARLDYGSITIEEY